MTPSYTLKLYNPLSLHWPTKLWLMHDHDINIDKTDLEAKVRSSEYFLTLATILENIELDATNKNQSIVLQGLVAELLYLQQHYKISKK